MKFGSVCSGIEAASVAFNPLGWNAVWFSEIEPFPCELLKQRFPAIPNVGDMRQIPKLIREGAIEAPGFFCGGTPCQAFSVAGLRKSLADERGNLSLIFCEIAHEIQTIRSFLGQPPPNHSLGKRARSAQHQRQRIWMFLGRPWWIGRSDFSSKRQMAKLWCCCRTSKKNCVAGAQC